MAKRPQIAAGMRVAYSRQFLRDICQLTGEMPIMRGRVLAVEPVWKNCPVVLAAIQWDGGRLSCVNIRHLVREDRLHLDSV